MAKLTYEKRRKLPARAFAIDGLERRYPIHDVAHARNALARVSAFGTDEEKKIVRTAVYRKYPELRPEKIKGRKTRLTRKTMRITPKTPRLR